MKINVLVAAVAVVVPLDVFASDYALDLGLRFQHTDNVLKRSDGEKSELSQALDAKFTYSTNTPFFEADVNYDLQYETYRKDAYADEWFIDGNAQINFNLIPNRLIWSFSQLQRTQTIDSSNPATPTNTDERAILQTGPIFLLDLSPVDTLSIKATYIDTGYDKSSFQDSERNQGEVSWEHKFSELGAFTIRGSLSEVDFSESDLEYDNTKYSLEFQRKLKYGQIRLEYGNTEIEPTTGFSTEGGFAKINIDLKFSQTDVGLRYINELTDTSAGLGLHGNLDDGLDTGDEHLGVADIVERELAQSFVSYKPSEKTSLTLGLFQGRDDYQSDGRGETRRGFYLNHSYNISSNWSSAFNVRRSESDRVARVLSEDIGINETLQIDWYLTRRFTEKFRVKFGVSLTERHNDDTATQKYDEFIGLIVLSYKFGQR